MVDFSAAYRQCLLDLDVVTVRKLWGVTHPGLPQPRSDAEALVGLHMARTAACSVPLDQRRYSHAWLVERGFPSQLPDELKPLSEQVRPRVVDAVGISVKARSPETQPLADAVRSAMEVVVLDAYVDGKVDHVLLRKRMGEARKRTLKKLLG